MASSKTIKQPKTQSNHEKAVLINSKKSLKTESTLEPIKEPTLEPTPSIATPIIDDTYREFIQDINNINDTELVKDDLVTDHEFNDLELTRNRDELLQYETLVLKNSLLDLKRRRANVDVTLIKRKKKIIQVDSDSEQETNWRIK